MSDILVAEGVGKKFGGFVALKDVSVSFAKDKLSAIIGPNGAGKSTFFGPFIGAGVFQLFGDTLTLWTTHWQLYLGATFILFVLFFPRGIWGSILHWLRVTKP